jgi:hypothetical protein
MELLMPNEKQSVLLPPATE